MVGLKILSVATTLTFMLFAGGLELEGVNVAFGQFFENSDINGTNSSNSTSNSENPEAANIVLLSQKLKKASFGYRDLVGQVKNIGNDSADSINVLLTVYDKNGGVIGTETAYGDVDSLKPGQKTTFKFFASSDDFKGMDHYELSLKWNNADGSEGYLENAPIYKDNSAKNGE